MSKALATKNVAAVLLGLGLVLGFMFAFVGSAKADTLSDLQTQVQALLAQIAALQGSGTATASSGACFTFTQNEQQGSSGGQVMWIQEFLNGHGFTVAASGAGSPGNETSYYGALTAAAVTKFQNAYAAQILTPEGLTSGTGNWFAGTRAEANALCAGSTTGTGTTGTGATSTGPGITVSAAAQPANSLAPENATRVPFTTFTLTNNSGAAVTINSIEVQRTGLAQDAAFAGVVLVDPNGLQIGVSRTFDSNHQAAIGTPFTLNAGQSETFTVAGNMAADESAFAGEVAGISVIGVNTSVPVAGTLPITGAQQTINATLTIGTAIAQVSSYDPNSYRTEPIGTTGLIFSGIRVTAGSAEDEKLFSITWNQTGSIGSGDLSNLVTVVNGTSYPVTVDSTGKYFSSVFPGGILIPKGNTVDAYIQGDVTGNDASGRTIEFDIYRQSDVYLVGQTYGYGVTLVPNTGNTYVAQSATADKSIFVATPDNCSGTTCSIGSPFFEGSLTLVQPGTLSTVGNAGSVGSQNIAPNVTGQPLGGFTTNFTGEPVSVQSLTIHVASTTGLTYSNGHLTSVSIVDQNGNTVAGPVDETSSGTLVFNTSITFPVGPMTYTLKGTVPSNAPNGSTYQLTTNPQNDWTGAQGQTSGANVTLPDTTITMTTMTVQTGTLVVSAASTPASSTVAPGRSNFTVANINLDASQSGEDIRINSLPIIITATSTGAIAEAQYLTNCQLYNGSTALNSQSIGSGQWQSVTNTGIGTNDGIEANFVFQNALTIPKGQVVTLALECNIGSSIPNVDVFSAGVSANYTVSTTGVQSGNSYTITPSTSVSGTMTPGTANLTVSVPTPVSYSQVSGGSTGVTVGTFTLQPTADTVSMQNIALALNSNYASSSDISRAYIYNGSTEVGSVIFTGSPITDASVGNGMYYIATTSASALSLPQNVQTTLTIKADVNQVGLGQAAQSGHEIKIGLANAQGTGASSGTQVNSGTAGASNNNSAAGVAIFRSYPVVAASSYLPSNGVADGRLIAFTVTANANGPVGLNQLVFSISTTSINALTGLNLFAYTDSGFSQPAGGTTNGGQVGTTAYNGTTQYATTTASTPLEIPAGTTEYFILKGTVSPGSSTSYNIATTLRGDSTDLAPSMFAAATLQPGNNFVWSPNSTTTTPTTNVDWTNGYGVSGLPASGIVQNRTQ